VSFDPKWGGPESVVFEKLEDWTKRPEEGIRHYSGTAIYWKTFDLPQNVFEKSNSPSRKAGGSDARASGEGLCPLSGPDRPTLPKGSVNFRTRSQGSGVRGKESGRRLYIDLGTVQSIARVRLNGHNLGIVWTAPWRVEITDAVKPTGNKLEIDVVNLWPNRLIGDAGLPPEKRYTVTNVQTYKKDSPLLPSGLLGPVSVMAADRIE
jgi:hypothetical protein